MWHWREAVMKIHKKIKIGVPEISTFSVITSKEYWFRSWNLRNVWEKQGLSFDTKKKGPTSSRLSCSQGHYWVVQWCSQSLPRWASCPPGGPKLRKKMRKNKAKWQNVPLLPTWSWDVKGLATPLSKSMSLVLYLPKVWQNLDQQLLNYCKKRASSVWPSAKFGGHQIVLILILIV